MAMQKQLQEAERSVAAMAARRNDRWYPQFHIAARAGWINDPNGLSYFRGRYHVFFQHHPYGTEWGPMHWGHVSSPDMVRWQAEPEAFAPSIEADRDGVFSGSAVVADSGELVVYYTGHRWTNGVNEDEGNDQVQCMAVSEDGVTFTKKGVVIEGPAGAPHFRDPKVWRTEETWYMVVGTCSADNRGQIWLYRSQDMERWAFDRVLFEDPDPDAFMLECPDFFPLEDKWVLMYSPMGPKPHGYLNRNQNSSGYVVGTWAPGTDFVAEQPYRLGDWGQNYYAPQTFEAPDGRRICYGWMSSFTAPHASAAQDGWAGQLTVARELTLRPDGTLRTVPVREVAELRLRTTDIGGFSLPCNATRSLAERLDTYEVECEVDLGRSSAERFGFKIHSTEGGHHAYVGYDDLAGRVMVDRRCAPHGDRGYRSVPVQGNLLRLRILVDRGSIEVFVNDGEDVISVCSYPASNPSNLEIMSESGSLVVNHLMIHQLASIWTKPEE